MQRAILWKKLNCCEDATIIMRIYQILLQVRTAKTEEVDVKTFMG